MRPADSLLLDIQRGDAIAQIHAAFGPNSSEQPDRYPNNHPGVQHITAVEDAQLGVVACFVIHRDIDGDRSIPRRVADRQRNEIKGYDQSPEILRARYGQIVRYKWMMKIDRNMKVTDRFCHFFQLKGVGGEDDKSPVITLSGCVRDSHAQLELRYQATKESALHTVPLANWDKCVGRWIDCEVVVNYHEFGTVRVCLSPVDSNVKWKQGLESVSTWREGFGFIRPKWGIYRSLAGNIPIANVEDEVRMDHWQIERLEHRPGR